MKILLAIITLLTPAWLTAQNYPLQQADPLDTLDEVDLQHLRDTSLLSRRNMARTGRTVNTLDYVLDDRYTPPSHTFDHHWYDHIYVGGSFGVEQIKPQNDFFKFRTMSQVNLFVGKEFDKQNNLRFSVGGGWGYHRDKNMALTRIQTRLDYLYNLSTRFSGYNPARRMEVSLLAGAGLNTSWMKNSTTEVAPEGHIGLQLKCFTGPLGTINIEPYVGISSDQIDVSGSRNWRGYDVFYGVNVNYSCFVIDNLSKEARLKMLQSRLADERMVDAQTLAQWRTPWFVEFSNGVALSTSPYLDFGNTVGHQTTVGAGRWLSPVMGFRASLTSRSTRWDETQTALGTDGGSYTNAGNSLYISGRVEALFNPFGFFKSFKWDAPWGAYAVFGGEIGKLYKYSHEGEIKRKSEAYDVGVHLWTRLSRDLQVFVEPRFTHNVYTVQERGASNRTMHGDNTWGVDLGLTMLIRSNRFYDYTEMDETQNFIYREGRGFSVGLAGGMPLLQKKGYYYTGAGMSWNAMAYVTYAFNHLHSARVHGDLVSLNGHLLTNGSSTALWKTTSRVLFIAPNYQVNLTNLCGGRLHNRRFELSAYGGPAIGLRLSDTQTLEGGTAAATTAAALSQRIDEDSKTMVGFDAGLMLTAHLGKGISAFFSPTLYYLSNGKYLPGNNTVGKGAMRLYETLNVGISYKIGSLRRNVEVLRRQRREKDREWKQRQLLKEQQTETRRLERIKKRHAK